MRNKKFFLTLKIIVFFLIIILIIFCVINKRIGKRAMFKRLISGIYNLNYSFIDENDNNVYVLGMLQKIEYKNGNIEYIDYKSKDSYLVDVQGQLINKEKNNGIDDMSYYDKFINTYFNNDLYKYSYKGKVGNCTVIEFISKKGYDNNKSGEKNQKGGVKFWINTELNLIEKVEYFCVSGKNRESLFENYYNYHNSKNNIKQIKLPNTVSINF